MLILLTPKKGKMRSIFFALIPPYKYNRNKQGNPVNIFAIYLIFGLSPKY